MSADPIVAAGVRLLIITLLMLLVSIVLGLVYLNRWLWDRGVRKREAAISARIAAKKIEEQRQLELANANATAAMLNERLLDALLEVAVLQEHNGYLEHTLAQKERMRRIYFTKIKIAKEAGFIWPKRRTPARTAKRR